jgi:hypothetical protein
MKKYRALISGEGLLAMIEGQHRRVGFYTTRVVEAYTPEQAEATALASVKDEVCSEVWWNPTNATSLGFVLLIEEVDSISNVPLKTGLCFYEDELGS